MVLNDRTSETRKITVSTGYRSSGVQEFRSSGVQETEPESGTTDDYACSLPVGG
jgi:hypothetical protein